MKLTIYKLHKFEDFIHENDKLNYYLISIDLNKHFGFFKASTIPPKFIENEEGDKQILESLNLDLPVLYKNNVSHISTNFEVNKSRTLKSSRIEQIEYIIDDSKYDDSTKDNLKFNLFKYIFNLPNTTSYNIPNYELVKNMFMFHDNFIIKTKYSLNDLNKIFKMKSNKVYATTLDFRYCLN